MRQSPLTFFRKWSIKVVCLGGSFVPLYLLLTSSSMHRWQNGSGNACFLFVPSPFCHLCGSFFVSGLRWMVCWDLQFFKGFCVGLWKENLACITKSYWWVKQQPSDWEEESATFPCSHFSGFVVSLPITLKGPRIFVKLMVFGVRMIIILVLSSDVGKFGPPKSLLEEFYSSVKT